MRLPIYHLSFMFFFLFSPSLIFAEIKDLRAGTNPVYHRLVVEFDTKPDFEITIEKDKVYLTIADTKLGGNISKVSTQWFEVSDINESDKNALMLIKLKKDMDVKYEAREAPFRIVLDFYAKGSDNVHSDNPSDAPKASAEPLSPNVKKAAPPIPATDKKTSVRHEKTAALQKGQAIREIKTWAGEAVIKRTWRDFYMKKAILSIASITSKNELLGYSDLKENPALANGIKGFKDGNANEAIAIIQGFARENPESPLIPQALYLMSRLYEDIGFFPEAIAGYDRIVSKYPDKPYSLNAFMGKVRIFYLTDRFKDADELLLKVQHISDDNVILAQASVSERIGNPDRAVEIVKKGGSKTLVLNNADSKAVYLLSLAEALIVKQDFNAVKEIYKNIGEFYAEKEVLLYTVLRQGDIALKENKKMDAENLYKTITEIAKGDEGDTIANMAIAELKLSDGNIPETVKLYKMVAENPAVPAIVSEEAYFKMGEIYRKLGQYDEAVPYLRKVKEHNNGIKKSDAAIILEEILNTWFTALYKEGRYEEIVKNYYGDKRVRFAPETILYIADSFLKLGLLSEAGDVYKIAAVVSKGEQKNEAYLGVARLALQRGDVKAANNAVSMVGSTYKKSESYSNIETAIGDIYAGNGSYKEALAHYLNALKNREHPSYYRTVLKTAAVYQKMNQHMEAIEYYRFIVDNTGMGSSDMPFLANNGIGDSYYSMNRYEDAVKAYEEALLHSATEDKERIIWALYRLGEANLKLNRLEPASKAFEKVSSEADDSNLFKRLSMERLQDIKEGRIWKTRGM